MKSMVASLSGVALCLSLAAGCCSSPPPNDSGNLTVKLDIEKKGVVVDPLRTITSNGRFSFSHAFQAEPGGSPCIVDFNVEIGAPHHSLYPVEYKIGLKIPIKTEHGNIQYIDTEDISSVNIKLGEQLAIYESSDYSAKLTLDSK